MKQTRDVARRRWPYGLVKSIALVVGFPLCLLAAAAAAGIWIESAWLRWSIAAVAVLVVPLVVADRLLPKDESRSARGLVTDVLAVTWMGAATAVVLGANALGGPIRTEADRLEAAGWSRAAKLARFTAPAVAEAAQEAPNPSGDDERVAVVVDKQESAPPTEGADAVEVTTPDVGGGELPPLPPVPAPDPERKVLTPVELFDAWAPSVVTIKVEAAGPFGHAAGAGTGFVVSADGMIATNHHVIDGAEGIQLKLFGGEVIEKVEVLGSDAHIDLALLKVETDLELEPVQLGRSDDVTVGEPVIVIGNPLGLEHTLSDGIISSRRIYREKRYIQMTAPVSPGNSGGPVFNRYGEVVGVTVAKLGFGAGENLNLAVPVDELRPMIESPHHGPKERKSSW